MSVRCLKRPCLPRSSCAGFWRSQSTLPDHPHVYIFPSKSLPNASLLTLLPTSPPKASLAIGTTTSLSLTPSSFTENPRFLGILQSVLAAHATFDPVVQSQAAAFASQGGSTLGSGALFPLNHPSQRRRRGDSPTGNIAHSRSGGAGGGGAGAASSQGGVGGGGRGGWVHVYDLRNPPDYGRIAWPEDIFGSVEVDGQGSFVGANGNYQESGTYRIVTREGILGLSPYLRERLVERLKELEKEQDE